jgi:CheY-like chemotaxis protein
MARSEAPALILMDMSLPGLDGWEATRQIKARRRRGDSRDRAHRARHVRRPREGHGGGCDDFDTKPVDLARCCEKIEALLGPAGGA